MNIILHNRIEIFNGNKKAVFYNTMLESLLNEIVLKHSFNDYIAVGTGNDSAYSISSYKLAEHLKTYKLDCEFLQDDPDKGNLYIKKSAVIEDSFLDGKLLTEAGITNSLDNNPTIFNYFSLSENNNEIVKQKGIPLVISIYIFLGISKSSTYIGLLTSGKNKFVDFLLGNGLEDEIYCARGNLLSDNSKMIEREISTGEKYPCTMNIEENENSLDITFVGNLGTGPASEVLMLVGNDPFARIFTINSNNVTLENEDFLVRSNNVVCVGENINEILTVKNNTSQINEQNYITKKYATSFGDEITLPFHNLFDNNTSRFVSKDGKMIFFVIDDKVYGYINENYQVVELNTSAVTVQNIVNIIALNNFLFIISKNQPYIFAYKLNNNTFSPCEMDFSNFDKSEIISNIFKCDISYSSSDKLMFAVIDKDNYYGWTFYFDYDLANNQFIFDSYLCSEYRFNFVLSMIKSNYNEAISIFLKGDEQSYLCKIVYHYADKSIQDLYTTLAYYLTYDTKEIYTYDRAIIVEQLSSPKIWIYLYPEINKVDLEISGTENEDYISSNLKYLAQKFDDGSYKFYNLIGYESFEELESNILSNIDRSKILDFVFLNDLLLIFLNDENKKIIAFSLLESKSCIEKVSSNNDSYNITFSKFNVVGDNNNQVIANFMLRMFL